MGWKKTHSDFRRTEVCRLDALHTLVEAEVAPAASRVHYVIEETENASAYLHVATTLRTQRSHLVRSLEKAKFVYRYG